MSKVRIENKVCILEKFTWEPILRFDAIACVFQECDFGGLDFGQACFGGGTKQSIYRNCSFNNSSFSGISPGIAIFEDCTFEDTIIEDFICTNIELVNCVFSGKLTGAMFNGLYNDIVDGTTSENRYEKNDFSRMELENVGFFGVDLSSQIFSQNENYRIYLSFDVFLSEARNKQENNIDTEFAESVEKVLKMLEVEQEGGNNQLFLDWRNFPINLQIAAKSLVTR